MMGEKDGVARGDTLGTSKATNTKFHQTLGNKAYELSNHLGNILAVIADNKYKIGACYEAKILSETDYYAYGMQMHGRIYQAVAYRFGLNGQEKSRVIGLSTYSAEFWEYDSRSGIRWNIDPVFDPNFSPYATFGNNPIIYSDPNGDKPCTDCPRDEIEKDGINPDEIPNGLWGKIVVNGIRETTPETPSVSLPESTVQETEPNNTVNNILKNAADFVATKLSVGGFLIGTYFAASIFLTEKASAATGISLKILGDVQKGVAYDVLGIDKVSMVDYVITTNGALVIGDGHAFLSGHAEYVKSAGVLLLDGKGAVIAYPPEQPHLSNRQKLFTAEVVNLNEQIFIKKLGE